MPKKHLMMNLMIRLSFFDINFVLGFMVWRDMRKKSKNYMNLLFKELRKGESCQN